MKTKLFLVLAIILFLGFFTGLAEAVTVTVDGGWHSFYWYLPSGDYWTANYSFTLTNPAVLTVTDAYLSGDQFNVTNNGSSIGNTSFPTEDNIPIGDNYDSAAADSRWSTGKFTLSPGSHLITGIVIRSAPSQTLGVGGLRVDTVIPEPTSLSLLGLGLLGLFGIGKKKKKEE